MRFEPTDEQAAVAEVVRSIVATWEPTEAEETEAAAAMDHTLLEGGWQGVGIPEEFGGSGYGLLESALVIEELGAVLSPSALRSTVSASRALLACVTHAESAADRTRYEQQLRELSSGARAAVGFVQPRHPAVIADSQPCDVVIVFSNGAAAIGDPTDFGLSASASLDLTRHHARLSSSGSDTAQLVASQAAELGLADARTLLAAELVGVARAALQMSVEYAKEREAFGKPIGSFQAVGHRLADTARFVDGARVMCHCAAWHADTGSGEAAHFARLALLNAQRAVTHATDAAMQVHGAYGFTWESGIHWYQRRAHVAAHLLGDTRELRREVAKEIANASPVTSRA